MLADISPNASRFDPYKNFNFRLKWDGRTVAGVSEARGTALTDAAPHTPNNALTTAPEAAGSAYQPSITLERGVTHDAAFQAWASQVQNPDRPIRNSSPDATRVDARPELTLDVLNERGEPVLTLRLQGCSVSEFEAVPDLDGAPKAVVIQHIKLSHSHWSTFPQVADVP